MNEVPDGFRADVLSDEGGQVCNLLTKVSRATLRSLAGESQDTAVETRHLTIRADRCTCTDFQG